MCSTATPSDTNALDLACERDRQQDDNMQNVSAQDMAVDDIHGQLQSLRDDVARVLQLVCY